MSADKLIIGLTGGIGSGKSAAADFFSELGITIIDADIAARKVVEPGQPALDQLIKHYGREILLSPAKQVLDRNKLRSIIFSNPSERKWLNNLLHPLIRNYMDSKVTEASSFYIIKVIPLLVESEQPFGVDRILVIDVSEDVQIDRVSNRDNITHDEALKIIQTQASREDRIIKSNDIINNDSTIEELEKSVKNMHNKYLRLANKYNQ